MKGKIKQQFEKQLGRGMQNWKGVTVSEADYREVLGEEIGGGSEGGSEGSEPRSRSSVVYLTAESEELVELEEGGVYVIGGLVDRNRHKGLCHRRAVEGGLRTGRLPIDAGMLGSGRSMVMTTNHVVDILLARLGGATWEDAVNKVLPERKRKVECEGRQN